MGGVDGIEGMAYQYRPCDIVLSFEPSKCISYSRNALKK